MGILRLKTNQGNWKKDLWYNRGKTINIFSASKYFNGDTAGKAACIIRTVPVSEGLDEVFEFVENMSQKLNHTYDVC